MSSDLMAPPFVLDVRVARSPITGLRYGVDGRATDLETLIAALETAMTEATAQRDDVRARLRPYEGARRALLERLDRRNREEVRATLEEDLALHTEEARLEERIDCCRQRVDKVRDQRRLLRELSAGLLRVTGLHEAAIDGPGAAENQAVRQLFHLIGLDHESSAQEIFEGPMQLLSDAALQTELVGRAVERDLSDAAIGASRCRQGANAALRSLHEVVFRLHPDELVTEGLVGSIRHLLGQLGDSETAQVLVLGLARRLRRGVELAVFRIVEEAAANAVRHGGATCVEVVLLFQPQRIAALVRDDGEGFDVRATEARLGRGKGLGLISMRQRATNEGGHLEVRSAVGEGTEVRVSFDDPV